MSFLYENLLLITWQQVVMWAIGGVLIYLAIEKDMEPSLLLPIGFGAILVNLPGASAVGTWINGVFENGSRNYSGYHAADKQYGRDVQYRFAENDDGRGKLPGVVEHRAAYPDADIARTFCEFYENEHYHKAQKTAAEA